MKLEPLIVETIQKLPTCRYVVSSTRTVRGIACTTVSGYLRDFGRLRNVPKIDSGDLEESGFKIVKAQMIQGGGRLARPCEIVVFSEIEP